MIRDPRINIAAFAALIVAALFAMRSTGALLLLFGYVSLVAVGFGGGVRGWLGDLRRLVPFFVIIVILNGLAVPGEAALSVFGRRVLSVEGVRAGAFFSVRLAVMALALLALVRTTPADAFARGVHALLRPVAPRLARSAAMHGFLAMSFVPLFADEFRRIRVAQSFRGATMGGGFRSRALSVRALVVPLIISAIRRSEQLALVVELRDIRDRMARSMGLASPRPAAVSFGIITLAVIVAAFSVG
jgi:energy-coupling factor transport system permease protein